MSLYEVEAVLGRKMTSQGRYEYKIKWKGYPLSKCTWEPEGNLKFVQELVNSFNTTHPLPLAARPQLLSPSHPPVQVQPRPGEHPSEESSSSPNENEAAGPLGESSLKSKTIQKKRGRKPKAQLGRAKKEDVRSAGKPSQSQSEFKRPRGRPRKIRLQQSKELPLEEQESEVVKWPSELGDDPVSADRLDESRVNFLESEPQPMRNNVYDLEELSSQAMILRPSRLQVLQMARKGTDYIYLVGNQQEQKWMTRSDVIRDNALSISLVTFYESRMLFLDEPQPFQR